MRAALHVHIDWLGEPERGQWCTWCAKPSAARMVGLMSVGVETTVRQVIGCPDCGRIYWIAPDAGA